MKSQRFFHNLTAIVALGFATITGTAQAQSNNVRAALEGELLVFTGDNLSNAITLTRNAVGDTFVVGRNGTTVNGLPSVRFPRAVLNSVEVLMSGGNDNVIVNNLVINNDLYFNLGDGNDTLRSGTLPTSVGANLTVEGGMGNEVIRLTGWSVGSDAYIDGQIGVLNSSMTGMNVGFGITLVGDAAGDIVSLTGCTSGDFTSIETKSGNDAVTVLGFVGLGLFVGTDTGADTIVLSTVTTLDDITINSGTQNDAVDLTDVTSEKNIIASLDAGDDLLDGMKVFAQFDAVFEGGAGDQAAATVVFERHAPGLLAAARRRLSTVLNSRVDADDIVQSTFKSFFRRASKGGYAAPKSGDLFNLLIVIAMRKVNARADYHLASSRDVRKTSSTDLYQRDEPTCNDMEVSELLMTIAELLEEFSELQRTIITLRLEGNSVQEIADKCDRSKRTIERELQAFRVRLSQEFAP